MVEQLFDTIWVWCVGSRFTFFSSFATSVLYTCIK